MREVAEEGEGVKEEEVAGVDVGGEEAIEEAIIEVQERERIIIIIRMLLRILGLKHKMTLHQLMTRGLHKLQISQLKTTLGQNPCFKKEVDLLVIILLKLNSNSKKK